MNNEKRASKRSRKSDEPAPKKGKNKRPRA